jgi:predicted DNA-binding transcriptional regulator AlpA
LHKRRIKIEKRPTDLITGEEVEAMTGQHESARYEGARDGSFAQPVDCSRPGSRKPLLRWVRGEVEAWVAARIAERDRKLALEREQERKDREILTRAAEHEKARDKRPSLETTVSE